MHPLLCLLLLASLSLPAQFLAPPASPAANSAVTVGYTTLEVKYHRPAVRGRRIFGHLQPHGELWRAGANTNTLLRTTDSITIGDHGIPPGTYAVFLIPRADEDWTWVLSTDTTHWGTDGYDPARDVLRYPAPATRLPERTASLEYRWMDLDHTSADLVLEWEWYRVRLPIRVDTDARVRQRTDRWLHPAERPDDYYEAARYYLERDSLPAARHWIETWAAATPAQFGRSRRRALITYALGDTATARRQLVESLDLARAAGNAHYTRMNEATLREWTRTPISLPADSVLAHSIAYHDPAGRWVRDSHALRVLEERPDGTARYSRLRLFPGGADFFLEQTDGSGQHSLERRSDSYSFRWNGQAPVPDSVRQRRHLTPEATDRLRDYYTYLWGLPMKLRDPGTLVDPTVHRVYSAGEEALEVEVRYTPETGGDVWHFLFDPRTYALRGYRFYHDAQGPGTGEYIFLEDEREVNGMRLPAVRHWYLTAENRYLGTDRLLTGGE